MKRILLALALICASLVSAQAQYVAPYSGAVSRTNNSKMADIVSVFDFIPVSLQAAIKAGTSTTDVSSYLTAMQAAVPAGVTFLFPSGQYNIGVGSVALTGRVIYVVGVTFTGGGSITGATATFNSSGQATTVGIANNAVGDAQLRQGVARSVIGVAGNATANVADIQGTTDQILRVDGAGTGLGFGSIDLSKSATVGTSLLGLANGGLGGSQAAATVGQIPVCPGSGGACVPTTLTPSLINYTQSANGTGVARTVQSKLDDLISAKDYGAVGNNSGNEAAALNLWLTAVSATHKCGHWPAGIYRITAFLDPVTVGNWCINGDGGYQTVLVYSGASTGGNIMSITGSAGTHLTNVNLRGFRIASDTTMTGGNALYRQYVDYSVDNDVIIDSSVVGSKKLYDGIFYDTSSWNWLVNTNVYTSHYGVKATSGAELNIDNAQFIANGDSAIYLGGGFGGLYTGYVGIFGGAVGIRVDTAVTGTVNNQLFISNRTAIDNATSAGIYLNDAISSNKSISMLGWSSSCVGVSCNGMTVLNWKDGTINIGGGAHLLSNGGNAIYVGESTPKITIDTAALLTASGGWGVFCNVGNANFVADAEAAGNGSGDYHGNCTGQFLRKFLPYTPTITATGGAFTTVSASGNYKYSGKSVCFNSTVVVTDAGTATGFNFTIPVGTSFTGLNISGLDVTTNQVISATSNGSTVMYAVNLAAALLLPITGNTYSFNGCYQAN